MAKKNETKLTFNADVSKFNDSIKKANQEMSQLRAEMKLNETQMKETGTSVEGLEEKQKNLIQQLSATTDKTDALSKKVQTAVRYYGENSDEVAKLKLQLTNAENAQERLKNAINGCTNELEGQKSAMAESERATSKLSDEIKQQESQLDKLKRQYKDYVIEGKDATDEAKDLAREIDTLSGSLKENKSKMEEASEKADKLDKSFESAGKSADNASGGGFTVVKGALADLASSALQEVISKFGELISYMVELPEATRELRQDMATLTTSFDSAGFSTETATNTWKELYAVFGEDDRAVEASNHISKMAKNQQELNDWVTITTGIWGTYQDSLAVEALAESANETIKTGKVTGNLADALNWSSQASQMFAKYMSEDVVTAEDAFNVALSECTTEQERQALITGTLTTLYGDSAQTYRDTAGAQMEAKHASAELLLAEAQLADQLEPMTVEFTKLKTELLVAVSPAIEKVTGLVLDALAWAKEHPQAMKTIIAVIGTLTVALSVIAVVIGIVTTAMVLFSIVTAPITLTIMGVVLAITALIAIGVLLYKNWGSIVAKCNEFAQSVKARFSEIKEHVSGKVGAMKDYVSNRFNEMSTNGANVFNNLKNGIVSAMDSAKNKVKSVVDSIKNFFATLKLSLPRIKLPHFSITGKLSLNPPSVPKLAIDWYKEGGIMTKPTIFGMNGNRLMAGGEAGAEAILPIDRLQGYIENAMLKTANVVNMQVLADRMEAMANRPIELYVGDRQIALATAGASDSVNGLRSSFKSRGLVL